jgi:hypothetical protein
MLGPLQANGLVMPDDFPAHYYDVVTASVNKAARDEQARKHHAAGWNGVAYRFLSCAGHDEAFTRAFEQHGEGPPPPERHRQEHELFGFFVTGLATLESCCYALYAMAVIIHPRKLSFPNPRSVTVSSARQMLQREFAGSSLTAALDAVCTEAMYSEWRDVRNALAHRVSPGRQFYLVTGTEENRAADWLGLPLTRDFTNTRRDWLRGHLAAVVGAAAEMAERHL